jgi:gliding motility-associated-like protein
MKKLTEVICKSKLFSGKSKTGLLVLLFLMSSLQAFSSITYYNLTRLSNTAGAYTTYTVDYSFDGCDACDYTFDMATTTLDFSLASVYVTVDGVWKPSTMWALDSNHRLLIGLGGGDYRYKAIHVEITSVRNGLTGSSGYNEITYFGTSTGGGPYRQDLISNVALPATYAAAANPGTPTASSLTSSSFNVSWGPSSSSSYQPAPTDYYVTLLNSSSAPISSEFTTGTSRTYAFTGLSAGTTYKVRVRALNAYGFSNYIYSGNITTSNQVAQTITFNALPAKTYGDADFSPGATASSGLTVTYSSSNTAVATIVSNNIHIVGAGSATIYANQAGNGSYQAAPQKSQTLTVSPKTLTVTGAAAAKTYDGNTSAVITDATLNGVINSDAVSIASPASGTYASASPGTEITVTPALTLTGAKAGNYTVTQPTMTGTITTKTLTVSGAVVQNKPYDGNTDAVISGATLVGVVGADDVSLVSATTGTFASANKGDGISVATNMDLAGADIFKYTLTQPVLSANITAKQLTVSGAVAANKIYDGNTDAVISGATLEGVVASEDVTLTNTTTGTFASRNVADGITVVPAMTIEGVDIDNYTLTQPVLSANITPKELTVTGQIAENKVYDGTTNATFSGGSLVGVIGSDEVILHPTGIFADKNIGDGITVTPAMTLSGAQATNYVLTQPAATSANITPKELTVSNAVAVNKIYDGNTTASISGATLIGVIGSEDVSLANHTQGTFDSPEVANGINVTTAITLEGADIGNYTLKQPTLSANITPKELTVSGAVANNKIYDSTKDATFSGASLVGVVGDDDVTLHPNGIFANANVNTGITVTPSMTITGAKANNYTLTQPANGTASITAKELTVSGAVAANKVYDTTTAAIFSGGSLVGVIGSDEVILHPNGIFANKNIGDGITVTPAMTLSGAQATNYVLTQPAATSANITPKELTVSNAVAANKIYDGNTTASISGATLVGIIGSEEVILANHTLGTFDSQEVANGINVTTAMTLDGADIGNYTLTQPTLSANITPKELTVSGAVANNKIYDSTTDATFSGASLVGVVGDDDVTLHPNGIFANANVNTGITVTPSMTITGAKANNYTLTQPANGTANITAKELTVSGAVAANKVYDGNNSAVISGAILNGVIGSEDVTLENSTSGIFADLNAGDNINVTTSMTITGSGINNYFLTQPILSANITPAPLSITTITASDKVYDATTVATLTGGNLTGIIGTEDVTIVVGTGAFANKTIGTNKPVTATGYAISGTDAANYQLMAQPEVTSADITPAPLTIEGVTAANKVYDANTVATLSGGTLVGVQGTDDVAIVAGTGAFANKTIGANKPVTATGYAISGTDAANYQLMAQPEVTSADITPAPLTIEGVTAANKVYDANTVATLSGGTLVGVQGTDDVAIVAGTGVFANKTIGTNKPVTATGYAISGTDAANYQLIAQPEVTSADITPAPLKVVAENKSREYGAANPTFTISYSGFIAGESVKDITEPEISCIAEASSKAGDYAISLSGGDSGNYQFIFGNGILTVTKAILVVSTENKSRLFGTANPEFTLTYNDFVNNEGSSDLISLPIATTEATTTTLPGTYPITISGGSSDNYTFQFANGVLTIVPYAGDTNGDGKITYPEIAGDKDGDGKITPPEIAGDINGDGEINDNEIAGDKDGDGKITNPEIAGDANGDGKIGENEIAGDKDGDGKITAPEIAGDTNGDGKIGENEIAGDKDGDGKITAPEIAGDTNGDGKIGNNEIAGDKDGDGKITTPEIAGDANGDGKISDNEIAGDKDGDGKITKPEIAGDTNGDGEIGDNEIAGDKDGDGKITAPEIAGDTNGDGKISDNEIAGDKDGDGKITNPEIAGDANGDGKISDNEIAGDKDGDGKITNPEIAGDANGDGKISDNEITGDKDGDGKITDPEKAGDNNGDGKITKPEILGDANGDGEIGDGEKAGDANGDGKIDDGETAGNTGGNGSGIAGDTNGDGKITYPEIAGDINGDEKITPPEIAGDKNGNGQIDNGELAGDTNGDGQITPPEILGDTNGDGNINGNEIAGDKNGNGTIDPTETRVIDPGKDHMNVDHLFSPNGDGINDYWKLRDIEKFGRVYVKIYDRWGTLLYESTNYQNDWDGTSKGKSLPEGAYIYFIKTEKVGDKAGVINIVR